MSSSNFLIVDQRVLPEVFKKTVAVKELMAGNMRMSVNEAVAKVGISRSAYYKYKDYVSPFNLMEKRKIITLNFVLAHRAGILAGLLNHISSQVGNILTINQGLPLQSQAVVTLSAEVEREKLPIDDLIEALQQMDGVLKVELVSQS